MTPGHGSCLRSCLTPTARCRSRSWRARSALTDAGNLHGDVEKLVEAGILRDRRVGRARLVSPGDNPVNGPLAELVAVAYGPRALVEGALSGVAGLEEVLLVGS
ncbi:hypothetical protein [uncultured Pseudokineococcus sp.]|uniref:hypothetical protein n=1 Tax=uncultured Pseudokineococcus sp. TaxID=1642928 RepID=UPI0026089366|nr:hypothetical protein [uncultured Pseudokineococcus sp.]